MIAAHRYRIFLSLSVILTLLLHGIVDAQNAGVHLLWAKTSEAEIVTLPRQSDLDAERNLYVVGLQYMEVPFQGNISDMRELAHIFVRKYDTDGNLLWTQAFGTGNEHSRAGDIRVDFAGGVIFSGYINDPEGVNFNEPVLGTFFCKLDREGNLIWMRPLSKTEPITWASTLHSNFGNESKMVIDDDNTIVIFSNFNPPGEIHPSHGLYISRYSSEGVLMEQHQITHDQNTNPTNTGGIAIDDDGNFIITGSYFNGVQIGDLTFGVISPLASTSPRLYLARFTSAGNLLWAKSAANGQCSGIAVATDSNSNIYLTGVAHGRLALGNDVINEGNEFAGFITMFDKDGQMKWVKLISGTPSNIKTRVTGELYVTGSAWLGLTFDEYNLFGGGEEIFILSIQKDLTYEGALVSRSIPSYSLYKVAHNTAIDDSGNIYTIGIFQQRVVFGCDTLRSMGDDMFITKYKSLPPLRTLTITGPELVCEGTTLTLSSHEIEMPATYIWQYPAGTELISQKDNEVHLHVSVVADTALVNVVIIKECYAYENARPYAVNVLGKPGNIAIESPLVCDPANARVNSNVAEAATSYVWTLPDGVSTRGSTETSAPFIDIMLADTFTEGIISAKAKNECYEGEASPPVLITLVRKPSPISFVNAMPVYCNEGEEKIFEVTSSHNATEYVWLVPLDFNQTGIIKSSNSKITVTSGEAGHKVITVFPKNDCHSGDSVTHPFDLVNPLPAAEITASACNHELRTDLTDNITWLKDGIPLAQDSSVLTKAEAGVYQLTASNVCGMAKSDLLPFNPFEIDELFIPNVITPNGDAFNAWLALAPESNDFEIEIFTRWGGLLYHSSHYQNDWGAEARSGTYYIRVQHPCLAAPYLGWLQVLR